MIFSGKYKIIVILLTLSLTGIVIYLMSGNSQIPNTFKCVTDSDGKKSCKTVNLPLGKNIYSTVGECKQMCNNPLPPPQLLYWGYINGKWYPPI